MKKLGIGCAVVAALALIALILIAFAGGSYNTAVKSFPAVFYAGIFGFREKPYFSATPGAEAPPKVQFDFGKSSNAAPAAEKP